jgi:hypothetical protein
MKFLPLSQPLSPGDKMKISSGMSQSHMGDELIEIVLSSTIRSTLCKPYVLKDSLDQEFIGTTDGINGLPVIFNLSQSFGCTPYSQCISASSSSPSSHSLQSPQTRCPPRPPLMMHFPRMVLKFLALYLRLPNRVMIGAPGISLMSLAPTPITASLGMGYMI